MEKRLHWAHEQAGGAQERARGSDISARQVAAVWSREGTCLSVCIFKTRQAGGMLSPAGAGGRGGGETEMKGPVSAPRDALIRCRLVDTRTEERMPR